MVFSLFSAFKVWLRPKAAEEADAFPVPVNTSSAVP